MSNPRRKCPECGQRRRIPPGQRTCKDCRDSGQQQRSEQGKGTGGGRLGELQAMLQMQHEAAMACLEANDPHGHAAIMAGMTRTQKLIDEQGGIEPAGDPEWLGISAHVKLITVCPKCGAEDDG